MQAAASAWDDKPLDLLINAAGMATSPQGTPSCAVLTRDRSWRLADRLGGPHCRRFDGQVSDQCRGAKSFRLSKISASRYQLILSKGPLLIIKHFYQALQKSKQGKVINLSSKMAPMWSLLRKSASISLPSCTQKCTDLLHRYSLERVSWLSPLQNSSHPAHGLTGQRVSIRPKQRHSQRHPSWPDPNYEL